MIYLFIYVNMCLLIYSFIIINYCFYYLLMSFSKTFIFTFHVGKLSIVTLGAAEVGEMRETYYSQTLYCFTYCCSFLNLLLQTVLMEHTVPTVPRLVTASMGCHAMEQQVDVREAVRQDSKEITVKYNVTLEISVWTVPRLVTVLTEKHVMEQRVNVTGAVQQGTQEITVKVRNKADNLK